MIITGGGGEYEWVLDGMGWDGMDHGGEGGFYCIKGGIIFELHSVGIARP